VPHETKGKTSRSRDLGSSEERTDIQHINTSSMCGRIPLSECAAVKEKGGGELGFLGVTSEVKSKGIATRLQQRQLE